MRFGRPEIKPLLNTLYVSTQGAWLARDGETIAVRVEKETRIRVPVHTISNIVCFGQVSCSSFAMNLCATNGVGLSFLSENGRFLARVQGPVSGNVLLRRVQYKWSDDPEHARAIAHSVVVAKVANCRTVLLRAARDKPDSSAAAELHRAALRLNAICNDLPRASSVDSLRGHEGDAARVYFSAFQNLIAPGVSEFAFLGRSRRPPLDNMNALLSFLYTLLTSDMTSAVEAIGLDPSVGFLHRDRPGRHSLALDLVEELRPVIADRLALTLVNRGQIAPSGFRKTETGGVVMDDSTRKEVLVAYQKRKQEEIVHPFINERVPFGLIPHIQATLLSRHLRGDLDGYPSFLWR